jgi:hypothetical protein
MCYSMNNINASNTGNASSKSECTTRRHPIVGWEVHGQRNWNTHVNGKICTECEKIAR